MNPNQSLIRSPWGKWLYALAALGGCLTAAPVLAQDRYSFSNDGIMVTDIKTGLIWQRCSAGLTWKATTGTCDGTALIYTHEQALTYAKTQAGWRLPNVKELANLADRTRANSAIATAFPNTPNAWFWTATPYVGNPLYPADNAWVIDFNNGFASQISRNYNGYVRLVQ